MKKGLWKLIVAIVFLIVAITEFGKNAGAALVGIVIAIVFFFLWYFPARKLYHARPTEPAVVQLPEEPAIKRLPVYPEYVGKARLTYRYNCVPEPINGQSIKDVLGDCEKIVEVSESGDDVIFSYNGTAFAKVTQPSWARMVRDFNKRGDPVNAVLLDDERASLRFYIDKRERGKNREKTVVKLQGYKSRQEDIEYLFGDEELDYDEDTGDVLNHGSIIGKLPAKYKHQIDEEGLYAIFLDHTETEETKDGDEIIIPFVIVFW